MEWISCMNFLIFHADLQITEQPQDRLIVTYGESVTVCVSAVGSGQLSYEWRKDGQTITNLDNYTEINAAALTVTSFSDEDQGEYTCIVNNVSTTLQSNPSKLELSE